MIVAQVVVVQLVSRSLQAFGVVSRIPFFTLQQMWLPFLEVLPLWVDDINAAHRNSWPNKEDKKQQIKNKVELVRLWSWKW